MSNAGTSPPTGSSGRTGSMIALSALIFGILGAGAAWAVLNRSQAISASLFICAIAPWALLHLPKLAHWPGTPRVIASLLSAVMIGLGIWSLEPAGKKENSTPGPRQSTTPSAPASPTIVVEITDPPSGGAPRSMPVCFTIRGRVVGLAESQALVVAVKQHLDPRSYFEADVQRPTADEWTAGVSLDRDNPDTAGLHFIVSVLTVDKNLSSYLSRTSSDEGDTWWSNPELPPGAAVQDQVEVVRSKDDSAC
jgi:hypothetical protein